MTVGGLTMVSRVIGFVREMLLAQVLGAGIVADAFLIAQQFPNLFRRLFGEGAFASAFVPMFTRSLTEHGRDPALRFAEQTCAMLVCVLLTLVLVAQLTMPLLIYVIAPGFADEPEKLALGLAFTVITTPFLLFICLVALAGGILNALDRFAAMAFTPILFNVVLVAATGLGMLGVGPTPGHVQAWGLFASGVVQLMFMVWQLRRAGVMLRLPRPRMTPELWRLLRLMGPAALAFGVLQLNTLINTILASQLPTGAVTYLYFADRVSQLPLGVVGVAVATALLPKLTRSLRSGASEDAVRQQSRAIEVSLLLTLPAAVALTVAAQPIISLLFERGAFTAAAAQATGAALAGYAVGLPAFVAAKVLSTDFFAREDLRTPFKVSLVTVIANITLAVLLMQEWGHVGLALATSVSGWLNVALLAFLLARQGRLTLDARLRQRAPRIAVAAALMGAVVWGLVLAVAPWLAGTSVTRLAALVAIVGGGAAAYLGLALMLGVGSLSELRTLLRPDRGAPTAGPVAQD